MSLFKMKCGFDTLKMSINNSGFENDNFYISGNASINNVALNHWRIAPNDVQVKKAELQYKIFFEPKFFLILKFTRNAIILILYTTEPSQKT